MKSFFICIVTLLCFSTLLLGRVKADEITGDFTIDASEPSFENAVLEVSYFEHSVMGAFLLDCYILRDCAHAQGKSTTFSFKISQEEPPEPGQGFYVEARIYFYGSTASEHIAYTGETPNRANNFKGTAPKELHFKAVKDNRGQKDRQFPRRYQAKLEGLENPQLPALFKGELIVEQDVYTHDFSQDITKAIEEAKKGNGKFPAIPELKLFIELTNNTDKEQSLIVGGDRNSVSLEGTGGNSPLEVVTTTVFTEELRFGKMLVLKPGEKYRRQISMTSGFRSSIYYYWTKPGTYVLKFSESFRLGNIRFTLITPEIQITVKDKATVEKDH